MPSSEVLRIRLDTPHDLLQLADGCYAEQWDAANAPRHPSHLRQLDHSEQWGCCECVSTPLTICVSWIMPSSEVLRIRLNTPHDLLQLASVPYAKK
jgi:hypothetical protein